MADDTRLMGEPLSPLAGRVDEALALFDYRLTPAIEAIDDAVPGMGGLFDPGTTADDIRGAIDDVLAAGGPQADRPAEGTDCPSSVVLYVDGSCHGNPGPAGAGAVVRAAGEPLVRLGRPVGRKTGNNVAEYAALHLGLEALTGRYDPTTVEVRIDSMTVIKDVWRGHAPAEPVAGYSAAIGDLLSTVPTHEWTHLADSDPNPADAYATVGADIAALGPG